mmetsp:Transcript_22087/g.77422  ORF Transcript_22087/g.77422 Transcript_22087/m.77422 type:complete len:358 (-) Transcript_22087:364-1437(-)
MLWSLSIVLPGASLMNSLDGASLANTTSSDTDKCTILPTGTMGSGTLGGALSTMAASPPPLASSTLSPAPPRILTDAATATADAFADTFALAAVAALPYLESAAAFRCLLAASLAASSALSSTLLVTSMAFTTRLKTGESFRYLAMRSYSASYASLYSSLQPLSSSARRAISAAYRDRRGTASRSLTTLTIIVLCASLSVGDAHAGVANAQQNSRDCSTCSLSRIVSSAAVPAPRLCPVTSKPQSGYLARAPVMSSRMLSMNHCAARTIPRCAVSPAKGSAAAQASVMASLTECVPRMARTIFFLPASCTNANTGRSVTTFQSDFRTSSRLTGTRDRQSASDFSYTASAYVPQYSAS